MRRLRTLVILLAVLLAATPAVAFAHGGEPGEPRPSTLLTGWEFDPLFIAFAVVASWLYIAGARRVNRLHPSAPYPRKRLVFFCSGMGVILFALVSPFASYDTSLFFVHMLQHLLITLVAAPLLLLGTPITLALRAATPAVRKEWLLPILHSRLVRLLTFPVIAWLIFTAAMWGTHFSPLYDEALENSWLHRVEHFWYIAAALFFWWQVIGLDPTPWRMTHPVRLLYLFLQMPQNSFLAISIYGADHAIYPHYATLTRDWGPSALTDQQYAGLIMWLLGDILFLTAMGVVAYSWVQHEERSAKREDRAIARKNAAAAGAPPGIG